MSETEILVPSTESPDPVVGSGPPSVDANSDFCVIKRILDRCGAAHGVHRRPPTQPHTLELQVEKDHYGTSTGVALFRFDAWGRLVDVDGYEI